MGLFGLSRNRDEARGDQLYAQACAEAGVDVRYLLRASDLYPVYVSPSFKHVFGVEPERLAEDVETLYRFMPDEDRLHIQALGRNWDRASTLHADCSYLGPGPTATRRRFHVRTTSVMGGEYYLVEFTDVTPEREAMEAIEAERDRALGAAKNRTDFMSQMSHEIRTPLSGIKGLVSIARSHAGDPERLSDDLGRASDLANYLLSLINDVLDMSRLNSGHVELEHDPFDLRLVAGELRNMFENQAQDKGVAFSIQMDGCEDAYLVGDRMRLNQIVVNFISNAVKFTPKGGSVTVTFREMYLKDGQVNYMIRVRDTGKGMDPRFTSRIFKPFEQEDRTIARRFGGTGLGMAITSGLVDLMGGKIVVDTELGRGSDFTAYIPFDLASPEQAEDLARKGRTLETRGSGDEPALEYSYEGKTLLLAEDNDLNAMIASEILGNLGATVDRADDGTAVVEMFQAQAPGHYDAVIMDIQMPTMNGWEAARRIRALNRDDARAVPIIALSANNYAEDARKSREAGMNGHVGKPIDFAELRAQLAAATAEAAYRGANE